MKPIQKPDEILREIEKVFDGLSIAGRTDLEWKIIAILRRAKLLAIDVLPPVPIFTMEKKEKDD